MSENKLPTVEELNDPTKWGLVPDGIKFRKDIDVLYGNGKINFIDVLEGLNNGCLLGRTKVYRLVTQKEGDVYDTDVGNIHPHWDKMALYLEQSKTRPDAYELWEFKNVGENDWTLCNKLPEWRVDADYRLIPQTMKIGDIEVPMPVQEPLKDGQMYYVASISHKKLFTRYIWANDKTDLALLKRNLTQLDKESAITQAKAMLKMLGVEDDT